MNLYLLLVLFITVLLPQRSTEHNILGLFPHFGYSHFKVFYPILRGLAERGNNVTVITYIKNPEPHQNYNEQLLTGESTVNVFRLDRFTATRSLPVLLGEYFALHNEGQKSCEQFYKSGFVEEVLQRHANDPYDLIITEFFNTDCYQGVPYLMQLPVVGLSSCALMPWYYDRVVLPDNPAYVQSEFIGFPEELNWQQRLVNFMQSRVTKLLYRYHTNNMDNKIIKKYLKIEVDVYEYTKISTSLVLVNQHYSLSGNRPTTPQLKEIGGIHIDERDINKTLPSYIESFLESSKHGVLLISWGSMLRASSFSNSKLEAILRALQKLPLRIVWKWEEDKLPLESKQFLFTKWAPQLQLLCHPKVKLFWGHGGLLGVTEAVYCGKPMLITPIYGDQFLNGHAVENRKIGKIMHYDDIDENTLENLLLEIAKSKYSVSAKRLSDIFRNRETSPLHSALWWIEHLLRHDKTASELLHTKAVALNWFVYYSLDSVALMLVAFAFIVLVIMWLLRAVRLLLRSKLSQLGRKEKNS